MRFLAVIFSALLIICPHTFANPLNDGAVGPYGVDNTSLQDMVEFDSLDVDSGSHCTYRPLNISESVRKEFELHGYRLLDDNSVSSTLELETTEVEFSRTAETMLQKVQLDTCLKFDGYFGKYRSCDRKIIHFTANERNFRAKKTARAMLKSIMEILSRNYCR